MFKPELNVTHNVSKVIIVQVTILIFKLPRLLKEDGPLTLENVIVGKGQPL